MPFVGLSEVLRGTMGADWAVGGFDTVNLELTQAILEAAEAERSPVIVMLLPGHTHLEDLPALIAAVETEAKKVSVPVCLLLDHATTLQQVMTGIRLGCSAIMFDASGYPLEPEFGITTEQPEHYQGQDPGQPG